MFKRFGSAFLAAAGAVLLSVAPVHAKKKQHASRLPLKRLRLYDSGVGYFERAGKLQTKGAVSLPVPSSHLDDALKTLVVLSNGTNIEVQGMSMRSRLSTSAARSLAGFKMAQGSDINYWNLLKSLKGVRIKIRLQAPGKRLLVGRLLDANKEVVRRCPTKEAKPNKAKTSCHEVLRMRLSLVDEKGAIYSINMKDVESVQPTETSAARRLRAAMDTLRWPARSANHNIRIRTKAGSVLRLGYVAETPVWRSTYRLVLDGRDPRGEIQAWAIVHNDTDEDWKNVQIELVNGRPDSFLHPLAAPLYTARDLIAPKRALSSLPQLLGRSASDMWAQGHGLGGRLMGTSGVTYGGYGYGSASGRVGSHSAAGYASGNKASKRVVVGNLAPSTKAGAKTSGALFRYQLKALTNLRSQSSAMLPFAQFGLATKQVTLVSEQGRRVRSALLLRHQSGRTLPAGPVAIFADGGFVGESMLPRLRSGYEELIEYGSDLDVKLKTTELPDRDTAMVLETDDEGVIEHFVRKSRYLIHIDNRSATSRVIYLVLPHDKQTKIEGSDRVFFSNSLKRAVAVFKMSPASKVERTLVVKKGLVRRHAFSAVSHKLLKRLLKDFKADKAVTKKLRAAYQHELDITAIRKSAKKLTAELVALDEELTGLRKNVASLAGRTSDSTKPLFALLLAAQKRRQQLRKAMARRKRAEAYRMKRLKKSLTGAERSP